MPTQLTPDVWQLSLRGVNAYLITGDELTLVDAGTPFDAAELRSAFADIGVAPSEIDRVLLTHWDLDHVGTLAKLDLDAPVYAGSFDAEILAGDRKPPFGNRKGAFQRLSGLLVSRPALDVRPIEDGETVGPFTAYHTPGHTPGHTAFVSGALDVAVLGDLVTEADGALEPSPWYLSYDTDAVQGSIVDLAERAPDVDVACMGHGDPITSGGTRALADLAQAISRRA